MWKDRLEKLFLRLNKAGYPMEYILNVALPAWWEPAIADTFMGFMQTTGRLSQALGLEIESLQDPDSEIKHRDFGMGIMRNNNGLA